MKLTSLCIMLPWPCYAVVGEESYTMSDVPAMAVDAVIDAVQDALGFEDAEDSGDSD